EARDGIIAFGPFRLHPERHLLLRGEALVPIGSRALIILIALAERAGELVTKDELLALAWPNTAVEESNLRAQVAVLRRALCDDGSNARYIAAVPGRGYRFVAPVSQEDRETPPGKAEARKNNLPVRLTPIIGRTQAVDALSTRLKRCRFLTIVGPGGI